MRKLLLCLCFIVLPVLAEPSTDELRDLLIQGDIDKVISIVEKDINWEKQKINLEAKNSEYYAIALITTGDLTKLQIFLDNAIRNHPKIQSLKDLYKHLEFWNENYANEKLNFTKEEKQYIEILELFSQFSFTETGSKLHQEKLEELKKEITRLNKTLLYFPTKLDFLIELKDYNSDKEAESLSLKWIEQKRSKLFLTTVDFYELASAYKTLAKLSLKKDQMDQAKSYIQLGKYNVYKMRSLWLEEDIRIYRPILKIERRETKVSCVLPQWLMALRAEFDNYLQ